jgi:hypothetical protein
MMADKSTALSGTNMKPKPESRFVQAVLLTLAMLCGGALLLPGSDYSRQTACMAGETDMFFQQGNESRLAARDTCIE